MGRLGCCPAAGERRIGTVAVWRRLHAPPDGGPAARVLNTQNPVARTRDANGRAFSETLQSISQVKLSTVCRNVLR